MKDYFNPSSFNELLKNNLEYIQEVIIQNRFMFGDFPKLLNKAVLENRFDVVTYIVEEHSYVLSNDEDKRSLALQVCISGNVAMLDYLKAKNVLPDFSNLDVLGNITYNSENDSHLDMVKYIVQDNYDVSAFDESGLNHAVLKYNPRIVKLLVENGADISNKSYLAYAYSATYKSMRMFKFLEDNYGEIPPNSNSTLAEAVTFENEELVKYLIEKGWNLDEENFKKYDTDLINKERLKEVREYTEAIMLKKELEKELLIKGNNSKKVKL